MPLLTEDEFRYIVPASIRNNPLLDRNMYDIIHSYNTFRNSNQGLLVACRERNVDFIKSMLNQGAKFKDKTTMNELCKMFTIRPVSFNTSLSTLPFTASVPSSSSSSSSTSQSIEEFGLWLLKKSTTYLNKHVTQFVCRTCADPDIFGPILQQTWDNYSSSYYFKLSYWAAMSNNNHVLTYLARNYKINNLGLFTGACETGNVPWISSLWKSVTLGTYRDGFSYVCKSGNLCSVQWMFNKLKTMKFNNIDQWVQNHLENKELYMAAKSGNKDIVYFLFEKNYKTFVGGLLGACESGNYDLVQYLVKIIINDYYLGLKKLDRALQFLLAGLKCAQLFCYPRIEFFIANAINIINPKGVVKSSDSDDYNNKSSDDHNNKSSDDHNNNSDNNNIDYSSSSSDE